MQRLFMALVLGAFSAGAQAATVTIDPGGFASGTDISNSYVDVILSNAQGSFAVENGQSVEPLTLTGVQSPVYSVEGLFGRSSMDNNWSAGICCGGDDVLRVDFMGKATVVQVNYDQTDDPDTGWLFAYDDQDNLLSSQSKRDSTPFTLSYTATGARIAYILATFSDQGKISEVSYSPVPVPAAVWLFGSALGLLGWMRRKAA